MVRPCGKNENDKIAKRVYAGNCVGRISEGRPWKKWIDTVKDFLKKKEVRQVRRMVHDRSVCREFVRINACIVARRMNS